jgi:hypothetical protein
MNLYAYAGADPVNFTDPFGLSPDDDEEKDGRTKRPPGCTGTRIQAGCVGGIAGHLSPGNSLSFGGGSRGFDAGGYVCVRNCGTAEYIPGPGGSLGTWIVRAPVYQWISGSYHSYGVFTSVCFVTASYCTEDKVFDVLRRYPAPGHDPSAMVQSGDNTNVPFLGRVEHIVDYENRTITNRTIPNHLLHKGTVARSVQSRGSVIGVFTEGSGFGRLSTLNRLLSKPVWGSYDQNIKVLLPVYGR